MKIGIKYCGGCNPRYDRTGAVKELMKEYPEAAWCYPEDAASCDVVIAVTGCGKDCISREKIPEHTAAYICVNAREDVETARERLKTLRLHDQVYRKSGSQGKQHDKTHVKEEVFPSHNDL